MLEQLQLLYEVNLSLVFGNNLPWAKKNYTSVSALVSEEKNFHLFFCPFNMYPQSLNKTLFHLGSFFRRPTRPTGFISIHDEAMRKLQKQPFVDFFQNNFS